MVVVYAGDGVYRRVLDCGVDSGVGVMQRHSTYLAWLCLLNYVDAMFTLLWVHLGIASEANPLMETLVNNPPKFVLVKVLLVTLGCVLLHRFRAHRSAQIASRVGFAVYAIILLIHTFFVIEVVRLTAY